MRSIEDIEHKIGDESEERLKNVNIDPLTLFKKNVYKSKKGSWEGTKLHIPFCFSKYYM